MKKITEYEELCNEVLAKETIQDKPASEFCVGDFADPELKALSKQELVNLLGKALCAILAMSEAAAKAHKKCYEVLEQHYETMLSLPNPTLLMLQELQRKEMEKLKIEAARNQGISEALKELSTKGGKAAAERYNPLKELAEKLVTEKTPPYKSRRDAAIKIKDQIIAEGKSLSPQVILSKDQAEITITGWLKDAGILPPKPKAKK
jgi:hypothetical protein